MEMILAPAPQKSSNTAKAVVESIFRYKSRLLGTFATLMALIALYVLVVPRRYESEMRILVRNARPDYQITPEKSNGAMPQADVTEERINSEIEVLHSRDVLDRVIDPDWNDPGKPRTPYQIKAHERAVRKLSDHLGVQLLRKSNVIHVSYETGSPQEATATVERLLAAFLTKQHELERSSRASSFFASEQGRYKKELDDAQQKLAEFQQANQVVSLNDKEATLQDQITTLEQQVRDTDVQIADLTRRIGSSTDQLKTLTQRQVTNQRTVPNILAMEQLGTMLATYKNQRTALLTKFPPTDRLVQEVDQQIANTTDALKQAREVNASENSTDVNPAWQAVNSALTQNTIDLSAARTRRASLKQQVATLQDTLSHTEGSTVDFNTLQARVTELQGNYQLYSQKRNEAQVANAMDAEQLVNVAIAERPTFSATPSSPKIGMTLAMGTFAALFFAACSIFFAEMGRDTISAPFELEALSRVPVLATVPLLELSDIHPAPRTQQGGHLARSSATPPRSSGFVSGPLTAHRSITPGEPPATSPDAGIKPAPGSFHQPQEGIA